MFYRTTRVIKESMAINGLPVLRRANPGGEDEGFGGNGRKGSVVGKSLPAGSHRERLSLRTRAIPGYAWCATVNLTDFVQGCASVSPKGLSAPLPPKVSPKHRKSQFISLLRIRQLSFSPQADRKSLTETSPKAMKEHRDRSSTPGRLRLGSTLRSGGKVADTSRVTCRGADFSLRPTIAGRLCSGM